MSPVCASQALQALNLIQGKDGTQRGITKIQKIKDNANFFRRGLQDLGYHVLGDFDSPVIPCLLFQPAKISAFSRMCLQRKLAVVVVGAPATPLLKARVRFCISAAHEMNDLKASLKILDQIGSEVMVRYKGKKQSFSMPLSFFAPLNYISNHSQKTPAMHGTDLQLFHLIEHHPSIIRYAKEMCMELEYLIYAIAFQQSCVLAKSNPAKIPTPWELLNNLSLIVHVKEKVSCKDSGAVYGQDVWEVFHRGNVRERCYQFYTILCRDKNNRILKWLLNTSKLPKCINTEKLCLLKKLCIEAQCTGHFNSAATAEVKKRALFVSSQRHRVRRNTEDSKQDCLLLSQDSVIPKLSERELKLINSNVRRDHKLPWVTGRQRWVLPPHVIEAFHRVAPKQELISGLSGHTEALLVFGQLFRHFDLNLSVLLCVLWLVPCEHHTIYEVLHTAKITCGLNFHLHENPRKFCLKLLQKI